MTIEVQTDRSSKTVMQDWAPKAQRQGEHEAWESQGQSPQDAELVFPPISPRPAWPRIFPSL
jgi:hypothetical protein